MTVLACTYEKRNDILSMRDSSLDIEGKNENTKKNIYIIEFVNSWSVTEVDYREYRKNTGLEYQNALKQSLWKCYIT